MLHQPPRQQTPPPVVVRLRLAHAVHLQRLLRLLRKVEHLRRLRLHLERRIVRRNPRRELRVLARQIRFVQLPDQVDRLPPPVQRNALRQFQIQHRLLPRPQHRRLIHRRQEAVHVHRLPRLQRAVRIRHHHVRRQRLRLRAQARTPPSSPSTEIPESSAPSSTDTAPPSAPPCRRASTGSRTGHPQSPPGAETDRTPRFPTCPYFVKRPLRAQNPRVRLHELILHLAELRRPLLPVQLVQQRLRIERLEVRRPARHEQEDHRLRLRREVRRLRRQRIVAPPAPARASATRRPAIRSRRNSRSETRGDFGRSGCVHSCSVHVQKRVQSSTSPARTPSARGRVRIVQKLRAPAPVPSHSARAPSSAGTPDPPASASFRLLQPRGQRLRHRSKLPFNSSSACGACVDCSRRAHDSCVSGASNTSIIGSRRFRFCSR